MSPLPRSACSPLLQRQGESPFHFMGEAENRIHMWSLILLTNTSPHLPAIELEKKKKRKKPRLTSYHKLCCHQKKKKKNPLPIFEITGQSCRHNFLTELISHRVHLLTDTETGRSGKDDSPGGLSFPVPDLPAQWSEEAGGHPKILQKNISPSLPRADSQRQEDEATLAAVGTSLIYRGTWLQDR